MTHTMPTQHDAEEAMRPFLGALLDAERDAIERLGSSEEPMAIQAELDASNDALTKALDLLGVQR